MPLDKIQDYTLQWVMIVFTFNFYHVSTHILELSSYIFKRYITTAVERASLNSIKIIIKLKFPKVTILNKQIHMPVLKYQVCLNIKYTSLCSLSLFHNEMYPLHFYVVHVFGPSSNFSKQLIDFY
jgi:hypothetical protein